MPAYKLRKSDGGILSIDTDLDGYELLPPSTPDALCDIATWGRRNALTEPQAAELARLDFDLRRKEPGGCPRCFFHARRPDPGDCDRLCCDLRQTGLTVGVELSPYVTAPAAPRDDRPDPTPRGLVVCLSWCLLSILIRSWRMVFVPIGALVLAVILLLLAEFQRSDPRGPDSRGRGETPCADEPAANSPT